MSGRRCRACADATAVLEALWLEMDRPVDLDDWPQRGLPYVRRALQVLDPEGWPMSRAEIEAELGPQS